MQKMKPSDDDDDGAMLQTLANLVASPRCRTHLCVGRRDLLSSWCLLGENRCARARFGSGVKNSSATIIKFSMQRAHFRCR